MIPHITIPPCRVIYANAKDLTDCLIDGFSEIEAVDRKVRVVYGDYASLALLRDHAQESIKTNALWGAKLVENHESPAHTFVLIGGVSPRHAAKVQNFSNLVVHVTMVFQ